MFSVIQHKSLPLSFTFNGSACKFNLLLVRKHFEGLLATSYSLWNFCDFIQSHIEIILEIDDDSLIPIPFNQLETIFPFIRVCITRRGGVKVTRQLRKHANWTVLTQYLHLLAILNVHCAFPLHWHAIYVFLEHLHIFSYKIDEIFLGTAFPLSDRMPRDFCAILYIFV